MSIKPEADRTYFEARPIERDLANRLDEGFNVTYGRSQGELSMWLADPKDHLRERFGFAKELLTIYSPHAKTDARVLTAIENITRSPDFRHRVDRAVVLLIHSGGPTETAALLRENLDWIIVPISTRDLTDSGRGDLFLRAKIAETIGRVDLFGMSSPITDDKYFFGRNDIVQTLSTRTVERQENAGLFGLRKTGKTSVLFALQRHLHGAPVLVEYVDCQNPGMHAARWWQVLETIVQRCADTLQREHKRTARLVGNYDQTTAGTSFLRDIRAIIEAGNLRHVLLLFDEIEYITPKISGALGRHWDADFIPFWQTIRAVHHESLGKLSFVVAGVNPASVTTSHFDTAPNPIFQLASPTYLDPLDTPRVREMVRTIGRYSGLDVQEPVYAYLQESYGGHPFLIRAACSEVWRAANTTRPERRERILVESFRRLRAEITARLERPVKDILLSLVWWYPEEYDVLRILADGDESFVAEYMKNDPSTVLQFARYGLLTADGRAFAISELREFLREHGEDYKRQLSPFVRGDLPPTLLPEVPDLNVLGELFQKRCEIELKLRRAILLYFGIRFNWSDLNISHSLAKALLPRKDRQSNPADLFVGRQPREVMNELFTLDLKQIIVTNWDMFSALFGGSKWRFEMNMDTLNRARRIDGHAKPVLPQEVEEFRNSYSWLQGRLDSISLPRED